MVLLLIAPARAGLAQTNGFSFSAAAELQDTLLADRIAPILDCAQLLGRTSADYRIESAAADPDMPSGACTVRGSIGSSVEFLLNLPVTWNGRLYIHGNGGYGGESVHGRHGLAVRQQAVALGFATGFTNLGHDAEKTPGATWAENNREAEIDFSYRALHRTTVTAKSIIAAYYGDNARYSYFEGCSTGGGQGLKAAQRYPDDFDGIVVGAPVFDFVGLQLYGWNNQMAIRDTTLDAETVARLSTFILEHYDSIDGVVDGVIDDPRAIDFQPLRDLPKAEASDAGFSDAQIRALARIYAGLVVNGKQLAPGIPLGAEPAAPESGWATRLIPDANGYLQQQDNVATWLKFLAFEVDDPDYDWTTLDPVRDLPQLNFMSQIMDVTSTDFDRFRERGGKILMYHGWADTGVNPIMTADFYDRVLADNGPDVRNDFRLFMVPGMYHCRGGFNVDRFDAISPVIQWVEQDRAPASLPATGLRDHAPTRERPLCAYPDVARYAGKGSIDEARNFRCLQE
jgi:feruloyl esterase